MELIGEKRTVKFEVLKTLVDFDLPQSYLDVLKKYGFGNISETLFMDDADNKFFTNNFADYTDLWDWEDETLIKKLSQSLMIASTIDGDNVYCISHPLPLIILPRHSATPLLFKSFNDIILHYIDRYELTDSLLYFDSTKNAEYCYFETTGTMEEKEQLLINLPKQLFELSPPDRRIHNQQPKFIYQSIGGWVYLDLVYFSSVRVKYQSKFSSEAEKICSKIETLLKGTDIDNS